MLSPAVSGEAVTGPAQSPGFVIRLLDHHLVVVDIFRQEMRVLNPAASALWLMLDEGWQSLAMLQALLVNASAEAVLQTLQEWQSIGWLETRDDRHRLSPNRSAEDDPLLRRARFFPPETALPDHDPVARLCVSLGGKGCSVHLARVRNTALAGFPETLSRLRAVLTGLAQEGGEGPPGDPCLTLVDAGDGFWIRIPGMTAFTQDESLALASIIQGLFQHAYADRGLFATVHAAAVTPDGHGALLMPGVSGAGKSTLTAWLAAQGWGYLGDDVVALGQTPGSCAVQLLPLPTAIGVKPASWPILGPAYPALTDLVPIHYADRRAKYVPVRRGDSIEGPPLPIKALVLPRFQPGHPVTLTALSPVTTLCRLIECGVTIGERFEPGRVDRLLDLLEQRPCYELVYSSLEDAAVQLRDLPA